MAAGPRRRRAARGWRRPCSSCGSCRRRAPRTPPAPTGPG
ncbi:hypothetical protein [Streptomyces sp. NPDC126503]